MVEPSGPERVRSDQVFVLAVGDEEEYDGRGGSDPRSDARDLVGVMKRDVETDWTVRDDVRAKLRSSVKRLLVKHKYPPDKQPQAVKLVIEQMETMAIRDAVQEA